MNGQGPLHEHHIYVPAALLFGRGRPPWKTGRRSAMHSHLIWGAGRVVERATDVVAAIGIASWVSPALFDIVKSISEGAGLLMPVLGVAWLAIQIWFRLRHGK